MSRIYTPVLSGWPTPLAGGGAFSPTSISGLKLWLDAERGLYQDSGGTTPATADNDPVGLWQDQSGQGNHFSQATAGKRPLLKTNQSTTGKPGIQFDGVDDFMTCANNFISGWTVGHALVRLKMGYDPPTLPTDIGTLWNFGNNGLENNVPWTDGKIYAAFLSKNWTDGYDPPEALTSYRTYEEYRTGGVTSVVLEGTVRDSKATIAMDAPVAPYLGGRSTGGGTMGTPCITRLLVYDAPLSAGDAALVRAWLAV